MAVRIRAKMVERKKLACSLLRVSHFLPSIAWWQARRGKTPCQGRQPPKAGAEGPPLQGVLSRHTRPPRSTADPRIPPFLHGFAQPITHAMPNWIRRTALADILGVDFDRLTEDPLYEVLD